MGPLVDEQREKLGRLAQSHVVGQAGPETELAQEAEPGEPTFLIGPEFAGESIGRRRGLESSILGTGEQVAEPAVGRHLDDWQVSRTGLESQRRSEDLSGGQDVARGAALPDRVDGGRKLPVVQLHPLAAHTHERLLQPSQLAEFGHAQGVVSQYGLPPDVAQSVEADGAGGGPTQRGGPRLETHSQPGPRRAPPRGRQHAESGFFQQRGALAKEGQDARSVRGVGARARRGQCLSQRRDETGRLTEAAQKVLVRVHDVAPDGGQLGPVGPDVLGGNHETRVVDRLEGEIDAPDRLRTWRGVLSPPGSSGHVRRVDSLFALIGRRDDPKTGPYRFGLRTLRGVPHPKPPRELRALVVLVPMEGAVG